MPCIAVAPRRSTHPLSRLSPSSPLRTLLDPVPIRRTPPPPTSSRRASRADAFAATPGRARGRRLDAPHVAALVAGAAVAAQAALLVQRLVAPPEFAPAGVPLRAAVAPAVDAERIVAAHLFGVVAATAAPHAEVAGAVRVLGLVAFADPAQGLALLAAGDGTGRLYRVGDDVGGGLVLRAVYPDRAELEGGGGRRTAALPRAVLAGVASALAVAPSGEPAAADAPEGAGAPRRLPDLLKPNAVYRDGTLAGFRLAGGSDEAALRRLGIRPGDVITAVNGASFATEADGRAALAAVALGSGATVTVRRGNASRVVALGP